MACAYNYINCVTNLHNLLIVTSTISDITRSCSYRGTTGTIQKLIAYDGLVSEMEIISLQGKVGVQDFMNLHLFKTFAGGICHKNVSNDNVTSKICNSFSACALQSYAMLSSHWQFGPFLCGVHSPHRYSSF